MKIYELLGVDIANLCKSCLREVDKKMEQVSVYHSSTKSPRKGAF